MPHRDGLVAPGERVVCTVTGNGLKDPDWAISRRRQADPGTAGRRRSPRPSWVWSSPWRRRCWHPRRSGCRCRRPAPTWVPASTPSGSPSGCTTSSSLRITSEPGLRIEAYGDAPTDETNLVVQGCPGRLSTAIGEQPPGLEVGYTARIPHSRGLGFVGGRHLLRGDRAPSRLPGSVTGRSRCGSRAPSRAIPTMSRQRFTAGSPSPGSTGTAKPAAVRLEPAPGLVPVAFIPQARTSTARSRGTLPPTVSHADAARNAGRAALLVAAMTAAPANCMAATEDRLHQPYRLPALAEGAALIARLRAAGVPAVLSGSGPTVLALCRDSAESAVAHGLATGGFEPCELSIDLEGTTCAAAEG